MDCSSPASTTKGTIDLTVLTAEEVVAATPVAAGPAFIGADLLEILTIAMYAEPLAVYRELAQNSADAIEAAVHAGLLTVGQGHIAVHVDTESRIVTVRDNGIGIPNADFGVRMRSFGDSPKRGTGFRGFRGIGRLAALGYCRRLVFRSRSAGDPDVYEAAWDGATVRSLFLNNERRSLDEGVAKALTITKRAARPTDPSHFFEAQLEKVIRTSADDLASPFAIGSYLGQTAPVPFDPEFSFGEQIRNRLLQYGPLLELHCTINNKPIYKPYRDSFEVRKDQQGHIGEIEFFEIPCYGESNDPGALAWVGHSDYLGALKPSSPVRGLRLRAGNVAIGDGSTLNCSYREERFAAWSVGEVHVFNSKIRPNARRDDFETSLHESDLKCHLFLATKSIARRCHALSKARNELRSLTATATDVTTAPVTFEFRKQVGEERIAAAVDRLERGESVTPDDLALYKMLLGLTADTTSDAKKLLDQRVRFLAEPLRRVRRLLESETYQRLRDRSATLTAGNAKVVSKAVALQLVTDVDALLQAVRDDLDAVVTFHRSVLDTETHQESQDS